MMSPLIFKSGLGTRSKVRTLDPVQLDMGEWKDLLNEEKSKYVKDMNEHESLSIEENRRMKD